MTEKAKKLPLPRLPEDVASMEPGLILVWLDTQAACEALSKSARKKWRRKLRCDSDPQVQVAEARVGLYAVVCSAWWADSIYIGLTRLGLLQQAVSRNAVAAETKQIYPPAVERKGVGMVRCDICGIWTPRPDCRSGICSCCIEASIVESRIRMGFGEYEA